MYINQLVVVLRGDENFSYMMFILCYISWIWISAYHQTILQLITILSEINIVIVLSLSRVQLSCNPMDCSQPGFSVQAFSTLWSGLPFPSPGDLPDPGIEPRFPVSSALQADSLLLSHLGSPRS